MTDLYVSPTGSDSNPGTQSAPFASILEASRMAQPGTTVHVAAGTYYGGFETTTSGTASNPIHYVSDTKWGATIVPAPNSNYDMGWDNRGANVIIDGFQVDGTNYQGGTAWREGIYTTGSNDVVEHNNVHNIGNNIVATNQGGSGIEGDSYYGGSNITITANIVHDIGPGNANTIQGIYMTASGNVTNNLVDQSSGWGIALWHDANHVNIVNNTVLHNDSGGITVGGGDFINTSGPDDYDFIANNIVYNNPVGIDEYGATGTHNTYTHNLVYNNTTEWSLQNGLTASNTVNADPQFVSYSGGDYHLTASSPAIDAGTASNAPATDFDGNSRPQGAGYDIGAYEFVQATPTPTPTPSPTSSAPQPFTLPQSGAWTDTIYGTKHHSVLYGTSGNDYLDSRGYAHTIIGGSGDDTIVVYHSSDNVVENPGVGIDTVLCKATSYTLAPNVANMTLVGNYAHTVTGNSISNLITASNANDVINCGAGNDIVNAGTGADLITGGAGNDMFAFHAIGATSTITNFEVGKDLLDLRTLMKASGYAGSDPVADHALSLVSDGADGTTVMADPTHSGTSHALVTLQHVAPSTVHVGTDVLWH